MQVVHTEFERQVWQMAAQVRQLALAAKLPTGQLEKQLPRYSSSDPVQERQALSEHVKQGAKQALQLLLVGLM
jgi:hypothetical protein